MSDAVGEQGDLLLNLEARHDELLRQLDELDRRVAEVLRQVQPAPQAQRPTVPFDPAIAEPVREAA